MRFSANRTRACISHVLAKACILACTTAAFGSQTLVFQTATFANVLATANTCKNTRRFGSQPWVFRLQLSQPLSLSMYYCDFAVLRVSACFHVFLAFFAERVLLPQHATLTWVSFACLSQTFLQPLTLAKTCDGLVR